MHVAERIETTNNLQMTDFWKICGLDTAKNIAYSTNGLYNVLNLEDYSC